MEETPANSLLAIYPGSFDPLTNGHLDLIARGSRLVDRLIIGILSNSEKRPLFPVPERIAMVSESVSQFPNVLVEAFDGLLVIFAAQHNARVILRGIRAISDYEIELQMALMNRRLRPQTETLFLMASEEYSFISSRMIKDIFTLGGDVSAFVPGPVLQRLTSRSVENR